MSNFDEDFMMYFLGILRERSMRGCSCLFSGVGNAHASAGIALDPIRRDRVTQSILGERLHAGDRLCKMTWRKRHQHLFIRDAPVSSLRKAWQRQAGLAGL